MEKVGNAAANPLIMRYRSDKAAEIIVPGRRRGHSINTLIYDIVKYLSTGHLPCSHLIDRLSEPPDSLTQNFGNDEFLRREEVEKRPFSDIGQVCDVLNPCVVKGATEHQLPRGLDQPLEYLTPAALRPAL